ncbi:divergent polysaccharide deacetylase family protein [Pseudidiomarina insulisalsae]|uniref:Divergent polysaccharide deacetylase family protein n=1 Tax=Pseudidiomarina insulisalsae TaxID=575789 RepID=A0A432YPI8_9GAMM|nr:divergent polysaccharide deacetylase family protein [Pseudidiomarina insulisalsae]RUO63038.1 hypothetical protein CWI71_02075 [Pseudidiomarina insulisalsae]
MMRFGVLLSGLLLTVQAWAASDQGSGNMPPAEAIKPLPRIAIVIDDLGHNSGHTAFTELSFPVTLAILPFTPSGERLAQQAYAAGHEVMIHMPMQPEGMTEQTQEVLDRFDSKAQFIATLGAAFSRLPQARGLNNHQGSLLTAQPQQMDWLMQELKKRSLYFLDSRTTTATVAEAAARTAGIPSNRRHVFIDNAPSLEAIRAQWQRARLIAENQGYAIVIGHPHTSTLTFLQQLASMPNEDIELVYFSELLCEGKEKMGSTTMIGDYCW